MNTLETIKKRSSCRKYKEEVIKDEELKTVLNAGLMAPTATNRQELRFVVVKRNDRFLNELEEEKNRLRDINPEMNFYYNAPYVIFIYGEKDFRFTEVDAGIAVENMALAATELGLGNLIIGCVKDALKGEKRAYFDEILDTPEGYEYKIALAVGYKDIEKEPHIFDFDKQVKFL